MSEGVTDGQRGQNIEGHGNGKGERGRGSEGKRGEVDRGDRGTWDWGKEARGETETQEEEWEARDEMERKGGREGIKRGTLGDVSEGGPGKGVTSYCGFMAMECALKERG